LLSETQFAAGNKFLLHADSVNAAITRWSALANVLPFVAKLGVGVQPSLNQSPACCLYFPSSRF
jgi:hypothetical protein